MNLENFRREAREFVEANCPPSMRKGVVHFEDIFEIYETDDAKSWRDAMASRGWTAPTWPTEYGGGGLSRERSQVLAAEMAAISAVPPEFGPGIVLVGPTLLEFGTESQRQRHIPDIVSGKTRWCQGYSEPGAGSDLASLQTKAVLEGDHFVINGQKIWTSGAHHADWMFALVRTDPDVPKHEGISFVLLDMHQPGVTIRPIQLISGSSPFCETFFTDAVARRDDLVGELNKGWGISKKLLQFERAASSEQREQNPYSVIARQYFDDAGDQVSNSDVRDKITRQIMLEKSLDLTITRVMEESRSGSAPGATASIFKLVGSIVRKEASSLKSELRGINGIGWEGDEFSDEEIKSTREWLRDRAVTIYGGTDEVQMNIIAKRVLGLPD